MKGHSIEKLLVANRGEIACRIFRTCREMGILSVAVVSEADVFSLHSQMADETVVIGGDAASTSYLSIDAMMRAVAESGADAVHPGYGFLAENGEFAAAVRAAGVIFVGPEAEVIDIMGDKIRARAAARAAGVQVVPGFEGEIASLEEACTIAESIGFPVMVKASMGGGGKGMRVVETKDGMAEALEAAQNESRNAFGADRVFIEKRIVTPRHIEVQVVMDEAGNALELPERECSLQRRYQKVIEEAPSPSITSRQRKSLHKQAIALARGVGYTNVGTVEFIVDDADCYFLEMNTRLQVEHPVTEAITGLDLVRLQLEIAAGATLKPRAYKPAGWAMEARLCAENSQFLPSTGFCTRLRWPGGEGIRTDTGLREGARATIHYDPMVAKIIASGATRGQALERLALALDATTIEGFETNLDFLSHLLTQPAVQEGAMSTELIDTLYPRGLPGLRFEDAEALTLQALAACVFWRAHHQADMVVVPAGAWTPVTPVRWEDGAVHFEDTVVRIDTDWDVGQAVMIGRLDGQDFAARVEQDGHKITVARQGGRLCMRVLPAHMEALLKIMPMRKRARSQEPVLSPMPGVVVAVLVAEGDTVEAGQDLVIVEAMKMENRLKALEGGTVKAVLVAQGETIHQGQKLVALVP